MPEGHKIASAYVEVRAEDKTEEQGKHIGAKLTAGLGALGLGAILGKSLNAGLDVQAGQAKLNAQLGLTKSQAGIVGKAAGRLFSGGYGSGMDQINDAVKSVILNVSGMREASEADLERISGKVVNTANIFDQDLGGVTKAVGQMMKTGLAKSADEALDIITKGFQGGADKSEDFLDTLNEYGVQFHKMGLSGAQATGIISQGLKAGARDGDLVADAIKEFSIRAVDGSATTAAGFKMIGMSGEKMGKVIAKGGDFANEALSDTLDRLRAMPDPVKRSQAAVALFGSQAEDLGQALYAIHPETAAEGLGKIKGAADDAGKALNDNARANVATFFRQLQSGAINIVGAKVIPGLTSLSGKLNTSVGPAFKMGGQAVKDTTKWLSQHQGVVRAVLTVVGPAVGVYVLWTAAVKAWAIATRVATGVQIAFNAVMNANPVMLLVIGLGLLVGGLILAYQKVGWFRAGVQAAFRGVQVAIGFVMDHWKLFLGILTGPLGIAILGIVTHFNTVKVVALTSIRVLISGFLLLVSTLVHGAASAFGWVPGLGGKLKGAARAIDGFRDSTNASLAAMTKDITINADVKPARDAISGLIREAGSKTAYIHVTTIGGPGGVTGGRQAFATGGFPDDGEFTVGEQGPELMRKSGSKLEVLTNRQLHHKLDEPTRPAEVNVKGLPGIHIEHLTITVQADDLRKAADVYDLIEDAARQVGTGSNREEL